MSKLRIAIAVLVVAVFAVAESQAAVYKIMYLARSSGDIKIWRTKDGVRLSTEPAIEKFLYAGDPNWLYEDPDECNDHDLEWTATTTGRKCNFIGTAYSYNTFGDFLDERPRTVPHYVLMAVDDIEITCVVEFETWDCFLYENPEPDPFQVFSFSGGVCPDLPGYAVTETESGLPFNGDCEIEIDCKLTRRGENIPTLNPWGAVGLIILLGGSGAMFRGRRVRG